jgi:beta-lactamase regulating signal transducer with metallopeptidase domain
MNTQFIFSSTVALTLAHSLWQCALLALLAALSFWMTGNTSARWRHTVGMFWMLAMLIAPLVTFYLCWQTTSDPTALAQHELSRPSAPIQFSVMPSYTTLGHTAPWMDWLLVVVAQLWLGGVAIMLLVQYRGWRLVKRIEREPFQALPLYWQQRAAALQHALGISRDVSVRLASHVISPFTAHVLRPIIWLPLTMLTQLPQAQIEALLLHELAHIRRLDWVWNGLQCLIEAILFYHPGMWWLSRRIRQEREYACDDLAVAACGDAIALAEALTALHAQQQRQGLHSMSPRYGLAADGGSLMKRITHLLSDTPKMLSWRVPGALLFLFCSGSLLAMQVQPPEHFLTNLVVHASSSNALTPGNYREYTATYFPDNQRGYRVSMDAKGKLTEVYKEDGIEKPLTSNVRSWISVMTDMNRAAAFPAPPAPPALPALPAMAALPALAAPAAPPAPPTLPALPALAAMPATPAAPPHIAPPAPPEPPAPQAPPAPPVAVTESEDFKNMMRSVVVDNRLTAITGTPVSAEETSFHGSIHTWGLGDYHIWGIDEPVGGKAEFTVAMTGPKGRALVSYSGKTLMGKWTTNSLAIAPLATPSGK